MNISASLLSSEHHKDIVGTMGAHHNYHGAMEKLEAYRLGSALIISLMCCSQHG